MDAATLTNNATIVGGSALGNAIVDGTVPDPVGVGVDLTDGAVLTNDGTITAGLGGSGALVSGSTLINNSIIVAGYFGAGAALTAGASLANYGQITGGGEGLGSGPFTNGAIGSGVSLATGTTLTNAGTIAGGEGTSDGAYLATGAVATNRGLITSNTAPFGVYLAAGATFTNAGTISGDFFGDRTNGAVSMNGGLLVNRGDIAGAGFDSDGVVLNGGSLVTSATIAGSPARQITGPGGVGTYSIPAGAAVQFGTLAAELFASPTAVFSGAIAGFAPVDTIELVGVNETIQSYAGGMLTLTGEASVTLDLPGAFTTASFVATQVAGGTDITVTCFAAGTLIRTDRGEVAVEALREGDMVRVLGLSPPDQLDPLFRRVIWIGCRHVDCSRHPDPRKVWPVRISAGALGHDVPQRSLLLSPDHAVFFDGVLIPVKHLINAYTIVQVPVDTVTYYHVELPRHDVLFADGLAVESYLDAGDRANFSNGGGPIRLHPEFSSRAWDAQGCAPLIVAGAGLRAARMLIDSRTAARAPTGTAIAG